MGAAAVAPRAAPVWHSVQKWLACCAATHRRTLKHVYSNFRGQNMSLSKARQEAVMRAATSAV